MLDPNAFGAIPAFWLQLPHLNSYRLCPWWFAFWTTKCYWTIGV